jgi:hypothetical protein
MRLRRPPRRKTTRHGPLSLSFRSLWLFLSISLSLSLCISLYFCLFFLSLLFLSRSLRLSISVFWSSLSVWKISVCPSADKRLFDSHPQTYCQKTKVQTALTLGCQATRWSTRVCLTPDSEVWNDQVCTSFGPQGNVVSHVHLSRKARTPPCGRGKTRSFSRQYSGPSDLCFSSAAESTSTPRSYLSRCINRMILESTLPHNCQLIVYYRLS